MADKKQRLALCLGPAGAFSEVLRCEAEQARPLRLVQEFASRDALTGIKPKRVFVTAEDDWNRRMAEGGCAFSVVVCGVSGLKESSDTLGHQAGDHFIQDAVVCTAFNHSPVYRIGGEFATVLSDQDYGDRLGLFRTMREKIEVQARAGGVVFAIGMADLSAGDQSFGAVLDRAGKGMYGSRKMLKGADAGLDGAGK